MKSDSEEVVVDLGKATDITKAMHPIGCQQESVNPILYQKIPPECG